MVRVAQDTSLRQGSLPAACLLFLESEASHSSRLWRDPGGARVLEVALSLYMSHDHWGRQPAHQEGGNSRRERRWGQKPGLSHQCLDPWGKVASSSSSTQQTCTEHQELGSVLGATHELGRPHPNPLGTHGLVGGMHVQTHD